MELGVTSAQRLSIFLKDSEVLKKLDLAGVHAFSVVRCALSVDPMHKDPQSCHACNIKSSATIVNL